MKVLSFLSVIIISLFSFFSCNIKTTRTENNEKELTLVMAEVNPDGTIVAEMDKAFKQKVEELSNGKIKIDLHLGGTLGDEENIMPIIRGENSSIHLMRISAFSLAARGCTKTSLLAIPFTFKNREHFWTFATSDSANTILNEPYEKKLGVKGLFYGEEGFRHFFATKTLSGTSDFEGMKLRITSDKIMKGVAEGLKAEPVSIGFGNLLLALQTGLADSAEQPIANYLANHFHKVAPNMILDGHTLGVTEVIINSNIWDSLSNSQQHILQAAGSYAGEVCRKFSQEAEDKAKAQLIAEGAVFTEVNDLTPWKQACEKIISESSKSDPDLYQKILDMAK